MENAERVVVDTSALYALVSRYDEFHAAAHLTYRALLDARSRLFTTSYVLVETHALLMRRIGIDSIRELTRAVAGIVQPIWVDQPLHEEAWHRFEEREGSGLSLVDWTVLLAAKDLSAAVFTFDGDFRNQGVHVLPEVSS